MKHLLYIGITLTQLLVSCRKDVLDPATLHFSPTTSYETHNCNCTPEASYSGNVLPILKHYCINCHSEADALPLISYEHFKVYASNYRVLNFLKEDGYHLGLEQLQPDSCSIKQIKLWISNGMKYN